MLAERIYVAPKIHNAEINYPLMVTVTMQQPEKVLNRVRHVSLNTVRYPTVSGYFYI